MIRCAKQALLTGLRVLSADAARDVPALDGPELLTGLRVISADAAHDVPALDGRELCDVAQPMIKLLQAMVAEPDAGD